MTYTEKAHKAVCLINEQITELLAKHERLETSAHDMGVLADLIANRKDLTQFIQTYEGTQERNLEYDDINRINKVLKQHQRMTGFLTDTHHQQGGKT
jgi:hypothetical protein